MKLQTKRLILRELNDKDLKELVKQANNIKVAQYTELIPNPYSITDGKWFIKNCIKNVKKKPQNHYPFAICDKSTNKFMGMIGYTHFDSFTKSAELGYWIGEEYWRQGYMSEAVEKMISFGFMNLKLIRINAHTMNENIASNNLLENFGFVHEGGSKKGVRTKSTKKWHDTRHYGLLKEDWIKKKKRKIK